MFHPPQKKEGEVEGWCLIGCALWRVRPRTKGLLMSEWCKGQVISGVEGKIERNSMRSPPPTRRCMAASISDFLEQQDTAMGQDPSPYSGCHLFEGTVCSVCGCGTQSTDTVGCRTQRVVSEQREPLAQTILPARSGGVYTYTRI